jgi:nitroreductase
MGIAASRGKPVAPTVAPGLHSARPAAKTCTLGPATGRHQQVRHVIKGSSRRSSAYPVDPQFLDRWSPRAMSGEPLTQPQLMTVLDAARWAPSSGNFQPWRFLYALRGGDFWDVFMDFVVPANRLWAEQAGALVVLVSRTTRDDGRPMRTHSYDTGAAWMSLALQAWKSGLVAHGIQGFDYEKAARVLRVPKDHAVEAMAVLGHPGDSAKLDERLREREVPSDRRPLEQSACEGPFAL